MKIRQLIQYLNKIKNKESEVYLRIDKWNDKFTLHDIIIKEDYEYIMIMKWEKTANWISFIN